MIASVVMLMVLLTGLVATSSINTSLKEQYKAKALADAVDSGRTMAQKCLEKNLGVVAWASGTLRPDTKCDGTSNGGSAYLLDVKNSNNQTVLRTTFSVSGTVNTDANGIQTVTVTASLDNVKASGSTASTTQAKASSVRVRLTQWKDIVFGRDTVSACALAYDQQIYCWGDNTYGQLGDGTTTAHSEAKPVSGSLRFKSIVSGGPQSSFCAIATTDYAYCWGYNYSSFLGNGSSSNTSVPTLVVAGQNTTGRWKKVTMLNYSTCGLSTEASAYIYCWGGNLNYNFGNSAIPNGAAYSSPMRASGANYTDVAGGSHHVCGIAAGQIWCWGLRVNSAANWFCRIPGEPNPVVSDCPGLTSRGFDVNTTPTGISSTNIVELLSGSDEMCARYTTNELRCFGANFKGQAGDSGYGPDDGWGTVANRASPTNCVKNLGSGSSCMQFKSMRYGAFSACGIDINDEAWCWGLGQFSMHGDGNTSPGYILASDPGSATAGHVYDASWHANWNGTISSGIAVKVTANGMKFRKIFAGNWSFCAMNFSNQLYCWGPSNNSFFGIQDGVTRYYTAPILAPNVIKDPPKSIIY